MQGNFSELSDGLPYFVTSVRPTVDDDGGCDPESILQTIVLLQL